MDPATLVGLLVAVFAVGGAYALEGGSANSLFLFTPMMLVFGGTIGAATVTTSVETVTRIPHLLGIAFRPVRETALSTIDKIVYLAEKSRREGVLGLERDLSTITEPFFRKGIQMVVDGTDPETMRTILEAELHYKAQRHKRGITFFNKAGGFAPTMGILGTVLALVQTLSNASDASEMATAIAAAFIATLWGVASANLFFLPISDKLKMRHDEEIAQLEMIMEGIMALQAGENPRHIRARLLSFVAPERRPQL